MAQEQREIPLILTNGTEGIAIATGNNASWHCSCGRDLPLIGKSGQNKGPSEKLSVICSTCDAGYFVVPDGGDYKRAVRVVEL